MYKIEISTDNAAFGHCPGAEIARILRKLADKIEDSHADSTVILFDINGNQVGKAKRI